MVQKYTGQIKTVPERRADEIDYWITWKDNPFEDGEKVVIRQEINPDLMGPDIYQVLGTEVEHDPDKEWDTEDLVGVKMEGIERSREARRAEKKIRGIVTYREFTPKYAKKIENELREIGEIE